MSVPDRSQFARDFLGPRLGLVGGIEETRRHSFEAVKAGCVELRKTDPRWGLLEKTGGAHVDGFAADIWLYDLGDGSAQVVDVVGNAEGDADPSTGVRGAPVPSWSVKDIRSIGQWRAPDGSAPAPTTPPPQAPPTDDLAERLTRMERDLAKAIEIAQKAREQAGGAYLRGENNAEALERLAERVTRENQDNRDWMRKAKVSGRTSSRGWGPTAHSHDVELGLEWG